MIKTYNVNESCHLRCQSKSDNEIKSLDKGGINDWIRIKLKMESRTVTATHGLERMVPNEFGLRSGEFIILK